MILQSSRKNSVKQIGIISLGCGIFVLIFWGLVYKNQISIGELLLYCTLLSLLVFCVLGAFILPLDITADDTFIYIIRWFRKHKIPYSEIRMVELYMKSNGGTLAPMITITKINGDSITQSMAIMNDKNTEALLNIFKLHNVKVNKVRNIKSNKKGTNTK